MNTGWSKISLALFFIVAFLGTVIRSISFFKIPFKYMDLVHAHSHLAFQGWVYTIITLLLANLYLSKEQVQKGRYPLQFKLTVAVVVGVLISFSLQGYGVYSIVFSTLFQFLCYWFIYRFLKDATTLTNTISLRFVKTALWLGLLSTFFPYGIGTLSAKGFAGTEVYNSVIYTFMHLQYNGWFMFALLGLIYKLLEKKSIAFNVTHATVFYWLFTLAVIPAISLSLLGMSFSNYLILPAYGSALLQLIGLVFFIVSIYDPLKKLIQQKNNWFLLLFIVFLLSFILKVIIQCLSAFPVFQSLAFNNKLMFLAYLHLTLIGATSFLFVALLLELNWLAINWLTKTGCVLLIIGFIATEMILALGGLGLFYDQELLVLGSASMALGIFLLLFSGVLSKKSTSL